MIGTLQHKDNVWVVRYFDDIFQNVKTIPVHPDDVYVIEHSPKPVKPRVEFMIVSISLPGPDYTTIDIDVAKIDWEASSKP